ncbi:hypothetical protein LCGC14_1101790 [marine sediment metagenome]|uniref:Uncharacterized protein n=1 Tax=marine sediment metagenome TaxID=412755 RepID=A0A0F9PSI2_9ZZZZ
MSTKKRIMSTWKVCRGIVNDKTFKPIALVEIQGVERQEGDGIFYAGDVVETDKDLSRHNTPVLRFQKVPLAEEPKSSAKTK